MTSSEVELLQVAGRAVLLSLAMASLYLIGAFGVPVPVVVAAGAALLVVAWSPVGRRPVGILLLALPPVYFAALVFGGAFDLNPCQGVDVDRSIAIDDEWRWWPPRYDCRVVWDDGSVRVLRGSADGFLTVFAVGMLLVALLVGPGRAVLRRALGGFVTFLGLALLFV